MIHSIIKQLQRKHENKVLEIADDSTNKEMIKIWIRLPYLGKEGEVIVKSLLKKLKRYVKSNVKFVTLYQTTKSAMFCSSKDQVPTEQKSNVIYKIICPGCQQMYIGKTDRCFAKRMIEHGSRLEQPMYQHLINCYYFQENVNLLSLPLFNEDVPRIPNTPEIEGTRFKCSHE